MTTACMKPRERVLAALNYQPVDRVPIDLGATPNTTLCAGAYERLTALLGVTVPPAREMSRSLNTVYVDEAVLRRLPVDTRPVFPRPAATGSARWLDERTYVDGWGVTLQRPADRQQYDVLTHPLAQATLSDLEHYPWPDGSHSNGYAGLGDEARHLRQTTDYALCGCTLSTSVFDRCWMLRGLEQFLVDMLTDGAFVVALLDRVSAVQFRRSVAYLAEVGPYLDAITICDDMGSQNGPLIRPALYRELIKPYHRRYVQLLKAHSSAKVIMHSCGSIVDLIEDYIEVGVDAVNPVQVTAAGMALPDLVARFGGRITFWGGIDTQRLLPYGMPDDVRRAVRETLAVVGREGGYVLAAVHNIQDDVPPDNVWAMLDAAAGSSSCSSRS
jgi:uroporphyrinogen decarboxylase